MSQEFLPIEHRTETHDVKSDLIISSEAYFHLEGCLQRLRVKIALLSQTAANHDGVPTMTLEHQQAAFDALILDQRVRAIMDLDERKDVPPAELPIPPVDVRSYPTALFDVMTQKTHRLMVAIAEHAHQAAHQAGVVARVEHVDAAFDAIMTHDLLRQAMGIPPKKQEVQ